MQNKINEYKQDLLGPNPEVKSEFGYTDDDESSNDKEKHIKKKEEKHSEFGANLDHILESNKYQVFTLC